MDTVLLIINRKKIIWLHLWHHATIVVAFYTGFVVSSNFWIGSLNSFIHIIMYLYYADVKFIKLWYSGLSQDISWSSYGLILVLIIGLVSGRLGEKLALFSWLLITVLTNFADFILLRQWGSRINSQALFYLKNPSEAFASLSFSHWIILMIIIFLVFGFAFWGYSQLSNLINPEKKFAPFKMVILCVFLVPV
jgi:hypothetical protein